MDLNSLWFVLIGVIFCGFFFLEGFDYGVAILMPFLSKKDVERRIIINTIGPVWDGNEVWMILAAGAMFAVFPNWYATLFSSFYLFIFVILISLILRNVSFEFRSKIDSPLWAKIWDSAFFIGSLIPAFIWGIILTDLLIGIPINNKMEYAGKFIDLLRPTALAGGLIGLFLFLLHGAVFLLLKTEGVLFEKVKKASFGIGIIVIAGEALFLASLALQESLFPKALPGMAAVLAFLTVISVHILLRFKRYKTAMLMNGLSIILAVAAVFSALFPRVIVSSLNPNLSLDIFNTASSDYTLKVITVSACILLPVVIASQVWSYWIFRKRVNSKNLEY